MRGFKHLWQRIFAYSLLLVLLSLAMGHMLHRLYFAGHIKDMSLVITGEILRSVQGQTLQTAAAFLQVAGRHHTKYWLEDAEGNTVAGEKPPAISPDWIKNPPPSPAQGIQVSETGERTMPFITQATISLEGTPYRFFAAFGEPRRPPIYPLLSQGIVTMAVIGGLLALWMSRQVSRPLRKLQRELQDQNASHPLRKVTVGGDDEIADVARAVNRLVDSLSRHINGMKRMIASISHELRSPLARMSLSGAIIEEALQKTSAQGAWDPGSLELARKHAASLQEELEHMDKLIGATLVTGKLDLQEPGLFNTVLNLSDLCANTAQRYEESFNNAGLIFTRHIEPDLKVKGDAMLLVQLFSNLLDNAVKFTRGEDVEVRLELARRRGAAYLTVENSHEPLDEETLERIFEPFYRHGDTHKEGMGLGLSLVQKIIKAHNGDAMALSTSLGICICCYIPLQVEADNNDQP